ncbi:MAG: hypothetical protein V2I24_03875 [Halieaceae bacterium]|jgi:hypothetical protein|nr:hypothetical protein [Halieaceae bacterium]
MKSADLLLTFADLSGQHLKPCNDGVSSRFADLLTFSAIGGEKYLISKIPLYKGQQVSKSLQPSSGAALRVLTPRSAKGQQGQHFEKAGFMA